MKCALVNTSANLQTYPIHRTTAVVYAANIMSKKDLLPRFFTAENQQYGYTPVPQSSQHIEEENESITTNLKDKVKALKSVSTGSQHVLHTPKHSIV